MKSSLVALSLTGVAVILSLSAWRSWDVFGQDKSPKPAPAQWIWFDEGNPLVEAPAETRYFRRVLTLDQLATEAKLEITADNEFIVWINGTRIGKGNTWETLSRFNVTKHLVAGKNIIAVEAKNHGGPAGLIVRLIYTPRGKPKQSLVSDGTWRVAKASADGWRKADFDDSKWGKSRVLGEYGKVGPWKAGGAPAGPRKITAVAGFKVIPAVKPPEDRGAFSLVNMTFDNKGRLLVSQEGGAILLCTKPDAEGTLQNVADYCTQVKNCHGMAWVDDALLLIGDGPKGTGLYRCRDTKEADRIDEVTLLHRFNGGMGEHGPHAVILGPDNWLYIVIGNHAFASIGPKKTPNPEKLADNSPLVRWPTGGMGPDQGKPGSTEDVLLPRLNDANGHAANMLAPGGTIWRMDKQGKNVSLVAAGFRNQFDAAFNPAGELFSFDSDMEWDEGLPWYRAVRAIHCPPGADFVWRTGAANTPNYYLDSLPPLYETGRGSPVGLTFYDHIRFGTKYRGAYFMADWSLGIIYAAHLTRKGATYSAKVEKFCTGTPMNVTDLEVSPDGSLVFTVGGRGTAGGVYRIIRDSKDATISSPHHQPLAAWSRALRQDRISQLGKDEVAKEYLTKAANVKLSSDERVRMLTLLQIDGLPATNQTIAKFAADADAEVRAQAIWLLGVRNGTETAQVQALRDDDALVRRRACEALIRTGLKPSVETIWPMLGDGDPFVRTAARLVLQRIDPAKWAGRIEKEPKDGIAREAIVALCKINKVAGHADGVFARLKKRWPAVPGNVLDHVRTIQLVCCQVKTLPASAKEIPADCVKWFPHKDDMVNRELAILLTYFRRTKLIDTPIHAMLLDAIEKSKSRPQQIHYFYCLRLLSDGWTAKQKEHLATWYDTTRSWSGGASFTGFLRNIYREHLACCTLPDRKAMLAQGEKLPHACLVLAQRIASDRQGELVPALRDLVKRLRKGKAGTELERTLREAIVVCACEKPGKEDYDDLVWGLSSSNKVILFEAIAALTTLDAKPKADDAKAFRAVLLASSKLDAGNRWKAVELLRHWSGGRQFGADKGQWKPELNAWSRWFGQAFPKEPALPAVEGNKPAPSKYRYEDLLEFVTKGEGKTGDMMRGRKVFEKAQCSKCHKYGKDGEGLGPELTTLSKRFKRADVLESIVYPSKVISDQYRSTTIVTKRGQRIEGLAAVQGDTITVQHSDGTKTTLRKKDVDQQFSSLVSVMPEKLLDLLTKTEIADLFAYLESEPGK